MSGGGRRGCELGAAIVLTLCSVLAAYSSAAAQSPFGYAQDSILVRFKELAPPSERAQAHALAGARVHRTFRIVRGLQAVKIPPGMRVREALELYRRHPAVLYAEPNWIFRTQTTPSDPALGDLWGLNNTGQNGGVPGADIRALAAWDLTTGSRNVVVVVIDTGIDYTHPDLAANVFRNELDCSGNGTDDDGNGHADDCFGIDTVNGDSDPMDDNGHGTHVAGTIGAIGNNNVGVVGVNWAVRLMACKFLSSGGTGDLVGALGCLDYVTLMKSRGVNIVATSNSWSGGGFSQAMFDAIETHMEQGILFVAAAANNASDNDTTAVYPAGYDLPNVISVAATTRTDGLAGFSDYGRRTVHLGAPGAEIVSTFPMNQYAIASGTSMATPHVTGVAALLAAQNPARDWRAIKNLILAGGDAVPALARTITGKRLSARGALSCAGSTVLSRLQPTLDAVTTAVGVPVDLAVLHINCASPNGSVTVSVNPGGDTVVLADDGLDTDRAAGDGIYSGGWTPAAVGTYTLLFPDGSTVSVQALAGYTAAPAPFDYRAITGTGLNLSDDGAAAITPPFPILFGGGSFNTVFVGSNGSVSFTGPFIGEFKTPIPTPQIATLVAPWWDNLLPTGATQNVFWAVTGSAPGRELVIEWRNLPHRVCADGGTVRFQVVFFEGSSRVLFSYADTAFGGACAGFDRGGSASIGVQADPSAGTQYSFNTQGLIDGASLLWTVAPPPAISVTPPSQSFGAIALAISADRTFTVQNGGDGVVSGSATASVPFAIVAGGSYALSTGQTQQVTVRFSPTTVGTFSGSVTFSGGGGASRAVTGTGTEPTPVAPTGFTAVAASATRIDLAWQDTSGNETEFRIERRSGSGAFVRIATTGANVMTYADSGLASVTVYAYRMQACNARGCSAYTSEATATTPALPPVALSVTARGSAPGSITSDPAGISCASSCLASFAAGTVTTLVATPGPRARFKGWGGACSGTAPGCTVTLNSARSVTATFSMIFTDATTADLLPPATPIRAAHFTELLAAINAAQPGTSVSWPSPAPAVGGFVRAVHITTLRQAVGLGPVTPGGVIAAQHLNEVRLRIRALE